MERKQKIILGSFIGVVLILIIIFVLILASNKKKQEEAQKEYIVKKQDDTVVSQPIVKEQSDINEIINTARGFVEIYFTYSNSSDFSNARELYSFMTEKFKNNVDNMISKNSNLNNLTYYLKTTTVTNIGMQNKYDPSAENVVVAVSVIEKNVDDAEKESIVQKKYNVYMVKSDKWRVEDIKWKALNVEKSIFDSNL